MNRSTLGIVAAALTCLAGAAPVTAQCAASDICACNEELAMAVEGKPVSQERIAGALGSEPSEVFSRGGSQNIPVVCQAVKYHLDHDPTWFLEYFRIQADRQPPGFLGTEVLSPLYLQSVLGAVLTVRGHAADRGQVELVAASDAWLKALWGVMALATADKPIASATIVQLHTEQSLGPNPSYKAGVSVPVAGTRADPEGRVGISTLLHPFMSLALGWQPHQYTAGLRNSPGFYGGLLAAAISLGFPLDEYGRANFASFSPPPERFGLSQSERDTLYRFVASRGENGLPDVLALIGDRRPSCDLTFLRTTRGLTSWFGTSESSQRLCNRNKGPLFAATFDADSSHVTWLHPSVATNPAEGGESFRRGEQICARLDTGDERCIDVIGGETIYEVSWTRSKGLVVVAGAGVQTETDMAGDEASAGDSTADAGETEAETEEDVAAEEADTPPEGDALLPAAFSALLVPVPDDAVADDAAAADSEEGEGEREGETQEAESQDNAELPLRFHVEGTASGKSAGRSTTCLLDLDLELAAEVRRTAKHVEYAGLIDGRVLKTVSAAEGESDAFSYSADVDSENLLARLGTSGSIELLIPAHLESGNRFLEGIGRLSGRAKDDGTVRGSWTCAPFDIDEADASAADTQVVAKGSWVLEPN